MSEAGKLLTVDDEPELCKLLSEYLSDNGFEVRSALAPMLHEQFDQCRIFSH